MYFTVLYIIGLSKMKDKGYFVQLMTKKRIYTGEDIGWVSSKIAIMLEGGEP
jgi:hypothetical protein